MIYVWLIECCNSYSRITAVIINVIANITKQIMEYLSDLQRANRSHPVLAYLTALLASRHHFQQILWHPKRKNVSGHAGALLQEFIFHVEISTSSAKISQRWCPVSNQTSAERTDENITTTYRVRRINTLRPRQNGRHFPDDIFKWIFLNEDVRISINISLKFVPRGPINNIPTLVQVMAWRQPGNKPLSEPMMVRLPTHICVTRPQWVNVYCYIWFKRVPMLINCANLIPNVWTIPLLFHGTSQDIKHHQQNSHKVLAYLDFIYC